MKKSKILFYLIICVILKVQCELTNEESLLYKDIINSPKFSLPDKSKYQNANELKCQNATYYCSGHGKCDKNENECKCDPRYTTSKSSFLQCNYYQKRKLYALLLESLIGFGFGHLYSGNYTLFISKFLFFFFTCYFGLCLMIFVGAVNNSNVNAKTYIYTQRFLFITIPLMIIWYFFDIIFYAIGRYKDGKGEDLY